MGLGTNHITASTHQIFNPTVWRAEAQRAREKAKVMAKLVFTVNDMNAGPGDTFKFQTIANLTATAKSASTQVTLQTPSETGTSVSINRYFESSFLVELIEKEQTKINLQNEYTRKATESVEKQMDSDLTGLYSSVTNQVGGLGAAVTEANLVRAIQYLDDADAPQDERYFVIRPVAKADMLKINKFTGVTVGVDTTSPGTVRTMNIVENGKFGDLYGVSVYVSTNIAADATTATIYHNLLFHREAFLLAPQIATTTDTNYIAEYMGWLTTAYALWGKNIYRNDHAVDFRST